MHVVNEGTKEQTTDVRMCMWIWYECKEKTNERDENPVMSFKKMYQVGCCICLARRQDATLAVDR